MILKTRRALFYVFLLLFIVTGFLMVTYSKGWRLNFVDCQIWGQPASKIKDCQIKFQKTGAIYIETNPKGVFIKLNNKKYNDQSGILKNGTLIENLLAKNYYLEISKEGYHPYYKNLKVSPEMVTKAENIILTPREIKKETILIPKLRGEKIISFNSDAQKFIMADFLGQNYYLYDLKDLSTVLNINLNAKNLKIGSVIKKVSFHPFDFNKLIIETEKGLFVLDFLRLKPETILNSSPLAWATKGSNVFYLTENKTSKKELPKTFKLFSFNLIIKTENLITEINESPVNLKITRMEISESQNNIGFLNASGSLYLYVVPEKNLEKIGHNVADFSFLADNKKIAFLDRDNKLNILFLEDWDKNNPKKKGELVQFLLDKNPVGINGYSNSYYLLLAYQEEIKFVEIDDRLPQNSFSLVSGLAQNFIYDPKTGFFYYPINGNLERFKID